MLILEGGKKDTRNDVSLQPLIGSINIDKPTSYIFPKTEV